MNETAIAATLATILGIAACDLSDQPQPQKSEALKPPAAPLTPRVDMMVFETIELGKPVELPACNDPVPRRPCVQTWRGAGPLMIYIPALQVQNRYRMLVEVERVDGSAERAWVRSRDHIGDDIAMLADLTQKYGHPARISRTNERLGRTAIWELGTLQVFWWGRDLEHAHGVALIQTPKGRAASKAEQDAIASATPKL